MKTITKIRSTISLVICFTLGVWASSNTCIMAQNSSLFQKGGPAVSSQGNRGAMMGNAPAGQLNQMAEIQEDQGLPMDAASWTYLPPTPPRVMKLRDIVSIRVDEVARSQAEGSANTRKNGQYDALLRNWVVLNGIRKAEVTPQTLGDPRINGQTTQVNRADSDLETRESLAFNIAAEVIDIRPNGTILLEARKTLTLNDNVWETTLSGVCRSDDIGPDNVVLSRDLVDLQIDKQDRGQVRDGYRRGWFTHWLQALNPF